MAEPRYETIRPRTRRMGVRIVHLPSVGSTMDEARREAEQGAPEGTVVVADAQTHGRGRLERTWFSPPGSLYASLLLRPPASGQLSLLSTAVGVSLARSCERLVRAPVKLKWPNDLWLEEKKLGGILIESRFEAERPVFVIAGFGVNGDVRPDQFPAGLRDPPTSLSAFAGRHVCMPALLKIFLEDVERACDDLYAGNGDAIVAAATERSAILGRTVRIETEAEDVVGQAHRLERDGSLVLRTSQGDRAVQAGDCRLLEPVGR